MLIEKQGLELPFRGGRLAGEIRRNRASGEGGRRRRKKKKGEKKGKKYSEKERKTNTNKGRKKCRSENEVWRSGRRGPEGGGGEGAPVAHARQQVPERSRVAKRWPAGLRLTKVLGMSRRLSFSLLLPYAHAHTQRERERESGGGIGS